ncbi:MAG: hypothetical protein LQ352_002732 [Teloschistes flavicans]|nr:MAG: hypothetical protein LQ352_002732 [Teloschistes flavicans]
MTSTELNLIAPLDSPLPPPPDGDVFTPSQWATLLAIADTIVPAIEASSTHSVNNLSIQPSEYTTAVQKIQNVVPDKTSPDAVQRYLAEKGSAAPGFKELIHRTFGDYMRDDAVKGLRVILSTLDTRAGCYLLTGYSTSFHLQPVNIRQQILQNWKQSYLPPLRSFVKGFSGLFAATWVKRSSSINSILGFPRAPIHGRPGEGYDYDFLQLPPGDDPRTIDTDVLIVGSGCGGGVCAKNLAEAGHRVLVADRAYHFPAEHLPMSSTDGPIHLFHNGGVDTSDDSSVSFLAGQAWGGGGTVNWSASLQTQGFVRQEWADEGLPFFTSSEYQNCLDRVCQRMGVSTKYIEHNENNRVIIEGARKLGFAAKEVPQNTGGNKHYCGYCTLGCGAAEKQGPVVSWLPDAARAGCQFLEGFEADRVMFEDVRGEKTAVGVQGIWTSRDEHGGVSDSSRTKRKVMIKAKRVIISCGTLHSPMLLLRSGLTNPQIGRNLHCHPATAVSATFPQPINPWEGGILTTLCEEFSNLDGQGHGAKICAMTMIPSLVLPFQPWSGGLEFKLMASKLSRMCSHCAVVRDRDTGRVYPDPVDGRVRIAYTPSAFDKRSALECVLGMCKIMYVEGAEEIWLAQSDVPMFVRGDPDDSLPSDAEDGINDPAFQSWLREIRKKGLPHPATGWGSAHQMGTCRMSATEKKGVVNPRGKVWGTQGLYVADASVFPSASGVNPMVTCMAISDMVSRGVARGLVREGEGERARL